MKPSDCQTAYTFNCNIYIFVRKEGLHVIFEELFSHYPQMRSEIMDDDAKVQEYVSVFINGRDIRYLNELDSTLNSQQKLDIFPPVAGG